MKYAYLITNKIEKELSKQTLPPKVAEDLEKDRTSVRPLDEKYSYCGHPKIKVHKWKTNGGPRFIYFEEIRGDITVYVLRMIYENHDAYTLKFDHIDKNIWYKWYDYDEEERKDIDYKFESLKEKVTKDILPDEYRKYEERPRHFEASKDVIVYEMPEWVNGYADVDNKQLQIKVQEELEAIVLQKDNVGYEEKFKRDNNGFYISEIGEYTLVLWLDTSSTGGYLKGLYLLQISDSDNREELVEHKYNCKDVTLLRRKAAKCYPAFLLLDFKSWNAIEDDSQANLALSDEELDILQDINYPFFVSGLAGSGKSTILYYLYAHIYEYEFKNHPKHPLLFLSYSNKLVQNAKNIVKSILCNHSAYNGASIFTDKKSSLEFDGSFQPFQEFLKYKLLSTEERNDYLSSNYIDYRRFKQLYHSCKLPESKNYSSDIVWSVIRTFIKGKSASGYFTPEDYESPNLPSKDRTVTKEDYRQIYKIWNNWYKKIYDAKEGWDDLDLVRFTLSKYNEETIFHRYAVIFCDEAQDFTKVETDLILKLSVYSKYDLTKHKEDANIPIAFAGDPNQTINPTGFRWGSTQEIFNESFKDSLASFTGFKPNELRTNYRSREGIVKFANTIQYIRHHLLSDGNQHFTLQEAWDSEQGSVCADSEGLNYVAFYSLDRNKEVILKGMQKAIIITADEGEYNIDHVQADLDLKNIDTSKLYTAITAKGLEFKATILYKFSSDPAIALFEKLINGDSINEDSAKYQLSHFFTKLYIAISRAKQVLFVVDTDEGYEKLWKYFVDKDLWEKFLKAYVYSNAEDLGRLSMGNIFDFEHRLAENYKPKEYAESLFKNALDEEDPEIMNRARSAYKEAKYEDKANLCKAYIFKFNKKYSDAGCKFLELGEYDLALESYWEGCDWEQVLLILHRNSVQYEHRTFKRAVASFLSKKTTLSGFLKIWKDSKDEFQESLSNPKDFDLWDKIVRQIVVIASGLQPKDITLSLVRDLEWISKYLELYDNDLAELRANLHFKRAEFENRGLEKSDVDFDDTDYIAAIECWNLSGKVMTKDYYTAKKIVSKSHSEEIIWMEKLGEVAEIISKYGDVNTASSLTEDAQSRVFNCLIATDMAKALAYPYPKDSDVKWNTLYMRDRANFLRMIILKEFTQDKFEVLKSKVKVDDANIFQSKTPSDIFDLIFALDDTDVDGKPYWVYFVADLIDSSEKRVFKNSKNRDSILEAIGKIIKSSPEISKPLATCFLEMLFDEEYDLDRAKKYVDVLCILFKRDIFFKEDFRAVTKRNAYFTQYCPITVDDIDRIKGNIHKFADEYLVGINKVTNAMLEDIVKPLFKAFEISVPYVNSYPNYSNICSEYSKFLNDRELKKIFNPLVLVIWIECRLAFNMLLEDAQVGKSTFAQIWNAFKNRPDSLENFVCKLSKEDTIAFIIATNRTDCDYSYDSVLISAKAIYAKRLRRDDFRPYCSVNQLRDSLSASVDQAIKELLSDKSRVKEYEMKLLTFVWEALGDHSFAAAHYDDLIDRKRLDKVTRLRNYFKRRALLHYSPKQKDFEEKQQEYNVTMTRDYLPTAYPKIVKEEESVPQAKITETSSVSEETMMSVTAKNTDSTESAQSEPTPQVLSDKTDVDPVPASKEAAIRMMKEAGMTDEQIMMCIKQLTKA